MTTADGFELDNGSVATSKGRPWFSLSFINLPLNKFWFDDLRLDTFWFNNFEFNIFKFNNF